MEPSARHRLTQTTIYRLDQESSYPVRGGVEDPTLAQLFLAHHMVMRDTTTNKKEIVSVQRVKARSVRLTCALSG